MGAVGFTSGEFALEPYQAFTRAANLGNAQAAAFRRNATAAQVEYVADMLNGPVQDDLLRMRAIAAASPFDNNMRGITGAQWFETATKYIDALKAAEDRLAADFIAVVRNVAGEARRGFWGVLALFVGLLAVTSFLAFLIALSITRPIGQLVATMGELAQGRNGIEVQGTERGDEIGQMATRRAGVPGRGGRRRSAWKRRPPSSAVRRRRSDARTRKPRPRPPRSRRAWSRTSRRGSRACRRAT